MCKIYLARSSVVDNILNDRSESRPTSKFGLARSSKSDFCLILKILSYRYIELYRVRKLNA